MSRDYNFNHIATSPRYRLPKAGLLGAALIALAMSALIACGKKSSDSESVIPGPIVVPLAHNAIGYYAQTANFVIPGFLSDSRSRLQPSTNFGEVLKQAMGVCDREYISAGLASCRDWVNGGAHDLVIYSVGGLATKSMRLIMRSTPSNGFNLGVGRAWYSLSLPDLQTAILGFLGLPIVGNLQGMFNPMVLETTLWPINNSKGFELRAYGPRGSAAWNKLFQLQVADGKLDDPALSFTLSFDGNTAATGSMIRCKSQHCGLHASFFNGEF